MHDDPRRAAAEEELRTRLHEAKPQLEPDERPVHIWADQDPFPSVAELRSMFRLTPAQASVAHMLVARRTNREISSELHISISTARRHVEAVLFRVGVSSRWDVENMIREVHSRPSPTSRRIVVELVRCGGLH